MPTIPKEIKIVETKIENDIVNNRPTLVFVDEHGEEWVYEQDGGKWMSMVKKKDSWYFKPKENGR